MAKKPKPDEKPAEPLIEMMMRWAFQHAERILVKHSGEHKDLVPIFAVMGADNKLELIATPWSNDHEKRIAQLLVRAKIKLENAKAYSFISEAWMLAVDKKEYPNAEEYDGVKPSQSERRVEVVAAVAVAKTDTGLDKRMATWEIVRNRSGRIVELKQMGEPYVAKDNVGGVMPSLMDDL